MQIKPKRGRSVPDPVRGDLLPSEGRNVEESSYWLRRLADGDVETVVAEKKKPAADSKKQGGE
ncbi:MULTISPECIES: DUF2635 domain-containing protein [Pantoea]|jgi:hypothetical protein|uniref:DUF2635 domain-containing protein n=1 Tax=Pantoea brenneri TaxID=472694 RepID=A0A7Y6NHW8_9GAMM|nr:MULTISPECIES: DUF2635 domain-containing protein [Pantoea]MBZ6397269.1 DUF2635 domain-containing protein [Pantoea sp.]MBZ6440489.1 DUF2635 domain-containing protein [Pantoea sp.]NUY43775.1 DUF2635 domain-containing protein [Pantoea brenneri]NUY51348.1 DUF2635 domain-containing protein [Pantoea brenneri]NUY61605.1 DUF2635 domain-containing protein [Pantoea brenneri]